MERVVAADRDGNRSTYVGNTVCDGPGQHRLVLTEPYGDAGRIVEIPTEAIQSVSEVTSPSPHTAS